MNKNKPKLLYIITQGHWGGGQKYVYDLATTLTNDFDITVAVGEPNHMPDLQKSLKSIDIACIQLRHLRRAISPIHDLLAIFELRRLYNKIQPDIIHLNSSKAGILGSLACQLSTVNCQLLIYTVHGWIFNEPLSKPKKKLYKFLENITAHAKNKIIVLSETEKQIGIKLGIEANKMEIIPIGIVANQNIMPREVARQAISNLLKAKSANFSESYIIGTIANFYPTKNLDNLIEAVSKIKNKLGNFNLILIGAGPETKSLNSKINPPTGGQNLEKYIHLPGFIENASKYLPAFDVFVLPSRKEGLPYTLLEARTAGIPIIATDVGAVNTIVENKKTGLLVPPEDINRLAEAIEYAYNNREEMQKMAQEGKRKQLSENTLDNMIEKTLKLYKLSL